MLRKIFLPYGLINPSNPVFQQAWKHVCWLKNATRVKRFNAIIWIGLPSIALVIWIIEHLQFGDVKDFQNSFINLLTLLSLVPLFISSLYSIPVVIGTVNTQFTSGYWNTLRLTSLSNNDILMAYDAIFQLRLWPFVAAEMGLRLSIFVVFTVTYIPTAYEQIHSNYPPFLNPLTTTVWAVFPVVIFSFFIEPIVRTRLIIALHLLTALRIRSLTLAMLVGILALMAVHLTHIILFDGLWVIIQSIANNDSTSPIALICLGPIALFAAATFWILYISVRNSALAFAYKFAFPKD